VRKYGITAMQYVGEICRYLLTNPPQANDKEHQLRVMTGTGLATELWQAWVARFGDMQIIESWGSTEANTSTVNVDNRVGSVGRVPDWMKTNLKLLAYDVDNDCHITDANGKKRLAQPGEVGEAVGMIFQIPDSIAGRFEGYTDTAANEKKIYRDVLQAGDAWWASGDLLREDEDGYLWFVDRLGDTFRWKSENVSTMEVADNLGDFPGVETITIYGVKVGSHAGRAGMAAITLQDGAGFDGKAFYELCSQRIPRYAAPLFVRIMQVADMTSTYKLRKVDLQKEGFDPAIVKDALWVRDEKVGAYVPYNADSVTRAVA
jgi:fatty-acyl-CoA synthase